MRSLSDPTAASWEGNAYWEGLITDPTLTHESTIHEMTGEVGDVYLLHPLMLHSASKNLLRLPRIITNPPVALKEPFKLNRKEGEGEYSLVERKTLMELGMEGGIGDWKIKGSLWISNRMRRQDALRQAESERLRAAGKRDC
jgi:hypothetical protein